MRTLLLAAGLLLSGCHSFTASPHRHDPVDDPLLCTAEQRREARYLLPYPDVELAPRSGSAERPVLSPPPVAR
jgi:hypothetical protein